MCGSSCSRIRIGFRSVRCPAAGTSVPEGLAHYEKASDGNVHRNAPLNTAGPWLLNGDASDIALNCNISARWQARRRCRHWDHAVLFVETSRVNESRRRVLHVDKEVHTTRKLDRIFTNEPLEVRVVVARPVVVEVQRFVMLAAR